jgi:apolipoprotein N-acyltransferase
MAQIIIILFIYNIVVHKKNYLVPFGEFIPFRRLSARFFFDILNKMGDIKKGSDANVFNNDELFIGSTICSENFFLDIAARRFVLNGAKTLINPYKRRMVF